MIRLILVLSAVALYLILSLPVLFYLRSLEKKDAAAAALKSLNMVRWILGIVRNLAGITCEVRGLENIPKDRAVLYVGNHRSYFDIVMGYTTVPSPTGFIAKKEMIESLRSDLTVRPVLWISWQKQALLGKKKEPSQEKC